MKKQLLNTFLIFALLQVLSNVASSQTVIDYAAYSSTTCNAFTSATTVNNIIHLSSVGQPAKNATEQALKLDVLVNGSDYRGTEYRVSYNFKKGYSYKITFNSRIDRKDNSNFNSRLRLDFNNGGSGTSPNCNGAQPIDIALSGNLKQATQIGNSSYNNYSIDYFTLSAAYSYMMVAAVPVSGVTDQTIYIKKITIEETAPELVLSPATLPTICGVSITRNFSVDNPLGLEGITSYEWNLGSASNGWLYNGSPAPQNISTTSNSLNLTSVCNAATVKNVGVTIKVNSATYKSYTSTVTRTTPIPTITGLGNFCYATPTYGIDNTTLN